MAVVEMSIPPEPKPVVVIVKLERTKDVSPKEEEEKEQALAPWATRVVRVKKEEDGSRPAQDITVEPAQPPASTPWSLPDFVPVMPHDLGRVRQLELPPIPDVPTRSADVEKASVSHAPRRKKTKHAPSPPPRTWGDSDHVSSLLCVKNYEAVDPSRELYGLINQGLSDTGTRSLIMHVRRGQTPWVVLGAVKPGGVLPVIAKSGRGGTTPLRVRFTSPSQYYSPGRKVTSMTIGVDEMDWQSLMTKAHRI